MHSHELELILLHTHSFILICTHTHTHTRTHTHTHTHSHTRTRTHRQLIGGKAESVTAFIEAASPAAELAKHDRLEFNTEDEKEVRA